MYYLGFDIGGSSIKAALIKDKKIIKSAVKDLPDNLDALLNLVSQIKEKLSLEIKAGDIQGAGFAMAGVLDKEKEVMLNSPNIKFLNNQPIKKLFQEKTAPYSVKIEHDAHCFLLAEKKIGLAQNFKNVFLLTLGTGIGGAFMINGEIFHGAHGAAGEVGHMIIDFNREFDFEELAANKFIKKNLGIGSIKAEEKARNGDKKAQETLCQLGRNLGVGIANIINIFDPEAIILSGGIADAKDFILPCIKEQIEKFVVSPKAKRTDILFSHLGRFGGAIGAALFFEEKSKTLSRFRNIVST